MVMIRFLIWVAMIVWICCCMQCTSKPIQLNVEEKIAIEAKAKQIADSLKPRWDSICTIQSKKLEKHIYDSIYAARMQYIQDKLGHYGVQK